jgi:hypothetical protein
MTIFPILAFVAAFSLSSFAIASSFENVSGGITYSHYSGRDEQPSYDSYKFLFGANVLNENISLDLVGEYGDELNSTNSYNQLEAGVKGVWPSLYPEVLNLYGRVAVGQQFNSGESNFPYWSIEPGFLVNISDDVNGQIGYRYRNAFDVDRNFETNALVIGGGWMFAQNHGLVLNYEYSGNDQKYNMYGLGYTFIF